MDRNLEQLASQLGILTKFTDGGMCKKEYNVDEKVIRFFVEKLGYKAGSDEDIQKSLESFSKRRWQNTLQPVYVINQHDIWFDVILSEEDCSLPLNLIVCPKGTKNHLPISFGVFPQADKMNIGKTTYGKIVVKINDLLDVGYYDFTLKVGAKNFKSTLAVAPDNCYRNSAVEQGKIWGYALQLYSLRSERNWGVGDFTDLTNFVEICSRCGADIIGLNPLNILQHCYPEEASPYSSISRLFLNPIYIDVENVPEFHHEDKQGLEDKITNLRHNELIQYSEVYNLKIQVLEKLYSRLKDSKSRQTEFEHFVKSQGEDLEKLAIFLTMYEDKTKTTWGGWNAWAEEYKNSNSLAIKEYAHNHSERVGFFEYLQFEALRQFNMSAQKIKDCGLKVGFYRDLAVGVGKDSAELWTSPDLFMSESGAGAPPDAFFPTGQKWDLGAFNPYVLKERAYEPFIKILRTNMQSAGALRIDHVMGLMRLYVIPEKTELGTYLMYNFEDMLNIVAIESHLNQCMIVGESIGNVPEGFLKKLAEKNIYSLSVLWAERKQEGWGDFNSPAEYPLKAFTSIGTHDMAPLRMWWFGFDIKTMADLNMLEDVKGAYAKREQDRWKLLSALDNAGVWPEDNLRKNNYIYGDGYPEGIEEAVHRYVARSDSKVFLAQLEDILHVEKLQNLPGTDRDKHPNWRRKIPVSLENLENDRAYIRNISAIRKER